MRDLKQVSNEMNERNMGTKMRIGIKWKWDKMKAKRSIYVRGSNLLHTFQHLKPALGLAGFRRFITKSIDIALNMFDLFLLSNVHRLLQRKLLGTQGLKLAVITGEQVDRLIFYMRNARTHLV